jgi:hypothetical protein
LLLVLFELERGAGDLRASLVFVLFASIAASITASIAASWSRGRVVSSRE